MTSHATRYSYSGLGSDLLLTVDDEGLLYKSKRRIKWSEIAGYRASPDFFPDHVLEAMRSLKPRLALYLTNGDLIKIRGDILVRNGDSGDVAATAFQELVGIITSHGITKWRGPTEEAALYRTAGVLMVVGFVTGVTASALLPELPSAMALGTAGAAILAQLTFIFSPLIAKRWRVTYLREAT